MGLFKLFTFLIKITPNISIIYFSYIPQNAPLININKNRNIQHNINSHSTIIRLNVIITNCKYVKNKFSATVVKAKTTRGGNKSILTHHQLLESVQCIFVFTIKNAMFYSFKQLSAVAYNSTHKRIHTSSKSARAQQSPLWIAVRRNSQRFAQESPHFSLATSLWSMRPVHWRLVSGGVVFVAIGVFSVLGGFA